MITCEAIRERQDLTSKIYLVACGLQHPVADGSEEMLLNAFAVLQGIVQEYRQGGDQLVEGCTCGQHND